MQMTLEEYKKRFPDRPEPIPMEYAGKWIAWNEDRSMIVAHGERFGEVFDHAKSNGCVEPQMQKVLPYPFVGSRCDFRIR